jgi:hypothetical protein
MQCIVFTLWNMAMVANTLGGVAYLFAPRKEPSLVPNLLAGGKRVVYLAVWITMHKAV